MPEEMRPGQGATAKQLADLLELTPRRVQQLAAEGVFPKMARGRYPLVECVRAYIGYWRERAEGRFTDNELDEARLRREQLEVRKKMVEVAKVEGAVVDLADHEDSVRQLLGSIRAVLLAIPGAWGSRVVGLETPIEGLEAMRQLADEIVAGVAAAAVQFEIEETNGPEPIPADFPGAKHLAAADITTMEQLRTLDDLTEVRGVGPKTAERIEEVLVA